MGQAASVHDAGPVHEVTLDGFWMDKTQVTNGLFAPFVAAHRLRYRRRTHARSDGLSRVPRKN